MENKNEEMESKEKLFESIEEDAENGLDQMVSVTLKQYRPYSTKVLVVDKNGNATAKRTRG